MDARRRQMFWALAPVLSVVMFAQVLLTQTVLCSPTTHAVHSAVYAHFAWPLPAPLPSYDDPASAWFFFKVFVASQVFVWGLAAWVVDVDVRPAASADSARPVACSAVAA